MNIFYSIFLNSDIYTYIYVHMYIVKNKYLLFERDVMDLYFRHVIFVV